MANTHSIDLEATESDYLTAADSASLSITGDLTLEAWVKPESQPSAGKYMISGKWNATGNQRSYRFSYEDDGGTKKLTFEVSSNGSGITSVSVDQILNSGTWYHVAVVYTAAGGTADFYVGGSQSGSQQSGLALSIFDSTALYEIGATGAGASSFFDGRIDDVRVWAEARTASEISANKDIEIDSETNLNGSWHLNNVLTDSSGNSNTLTNNGGTFVTDTPFDGFIPQVIIIG